MGKKVIDLHKILYPEEYKTTYVYTYHSFNAELKDLLGKSGYVKEFKVKYHKALRFLENLKKTCIMNANLFEQLKNADGIYSIILKGEKNIRILYDFQIYQEKEIVVIYNCFQEKATKDYSEEIQVAIARRKELFESEEEECNDGEENASTSK